MSVLNIVAAKGKLTLPVGWTSPVILNDQGRCTIGRKGVMDTFASSELEGYADEGLITLLEPLNFDEGSGSVDSEEPDFNPEMFPDSVYIYYRDPSFFRDLGIEISASVSSAHKGCRAEFPDRDSRCIELAVVTRRMLILALNDTCVFLNDRISAYLSEIDWGLPIEEHSSYEPLKALARCYYDVAFNREQAIRAITLRALVLRRSRNSHMLSEWLETACARWDIADSSMATWRRRIDSAAEQAISSSVLKTLQSAERPAVGP